MTAEAIEETAEAVFPASYAQQRLWFLDRFEGGAVYNVPVANRLRGPIDVAALEHALEALVERHEALRTVYALVDGVPHQVIRPSIDFSLEVVDVRDAADPAARAEELAAEQARTPFDLEAEPPFRALLVRLADDDHVLALTLHHIATDAWSMGILSRELAALYESLVDGRPAELPELEIQYADFAVWQQQWLESGGLDAQLDYWTERLAGAPPVLELPTDHPRPPRQSFRGATERLMLPPELLAQVHALGEREGVTSFMTLLAVFAALLARYSGQDDVVIASPVANRGRTELEHVIGLFVNTLPLRVDLDGDPSFRELLGRVREAALGAFSNQDLPFEKLVERVAPARHLSHAPVAQVMFVVRNALERTARLPGVEQEPILTDRGTAKFDVTFFATETPDGLRLSLEYCTDLFERDTARRMLEHYRVLLEAALADPTQRVGELRLLGADEERRVLQEWNETAAELPGAALPIHEAVAAQARATPDAVAVASGGVELSYRELDAQANRLARHLRSLGVGRETPVAICADRSVDTVAAVLAVLKAGGAYVPVDPSYPAERVAFMLEDCGAPVLVTGAEIAQTLPPHGARTVLLGDERAESDAPLESETSLDDLAYVIYTSGSTGRPKGVAMPHRPLANLLAWQREEWRGRPPARTLQFASLSFDVAFQELFSTWTSGGTLVLVDDDVRRDSAALLDHLAKLRVERLFLPFVALNNLCEAAEYVGASLPALREVITAGEQLKVTAAVRAFFTRHHGCALVNQYGPTETHVVTAHDLAGPADAWPELPPIGRPIANARAYVLDRHRRPVPVGVPGELWIGGVSVARGYLGRPELTAERFASDPFAPAGGRMYATGDVVRLRPDGLIEYLGRADHQAKIRGFRVEPGEVEAALRAHPEIREAFATVRDDGGEKRLVAFVIGNGHRVESAELRDFLRRSLPEYMVPAAVATVDAFPLTPNGKIDRDRLARLPLPEETRDAEYVAPRSNVEAQLAALWQKLLGVERVGVTDDFFELGGHSLLAVKLFSEIERKLGVRLSLSSLFETSTVAGLAELVEAERVEARPFSTTLELRPGNGEAPLFLIAWAGGEVLPYRDLVENLDSRIPVYGLRARGVDRRQTPLSTVDAIADYYVEEVRRVQPHGPYRLAGFCFSGIVAYEMARRLTAAGEDVSTLALIDSYPWRPRRRRTLATAGREQAKAFREAGREGRREWFRARLNGIRGRLYRLLYLRYGPPLYARLEERGWEGVALRGPWNPVLIASNLARRRYVPKPLDVRVQWFRAQQAPKPMPTPWDDLADVENHPIVAPGISHSSMMREPHVKLLVDALGRELGAPVSSPAATA